MNSSADDEKAYREVEWQVANHLEALQIIVKESNEPLEGNCFFHGANPGEIWMTSWWMFYKRMNFVTLIRKRAPKRVAEIGFNAGHSALLILHCLQPGAEMRVFDLNNHSYSPPAFKYLAGKYPQLREMIVGDSTVTLPEYMKQRPEEAGSYDIVHVDGGHQKDVVYSDVFYADILLKSGGVMILDDTNIDYIESMIDRLLQRGYKFLYQVPTYGYTHCFLEKP
jgi:hypothetical protein